MLNRITQITAYTSIVHFGQMAERFGLKCKTPVNKIKASDFKIEGNRKDFSSKIPSSGITAVKVKENTLILEMDTFVYIRGFLCQQY